MADVVPSQLYGDVYHDVFFSSGDHAGVEAAAAPPAAPAVPGRVGAAQLQQQQQPVRGRRVGVLAAVAPPPGLRAQRRRPHQDHGPLQEQPRPQGHGEKMSSVV